MDVHDKLDQLLALIEGARAMPMSGSCIVNRGEVLALVDDVRELLPEEFRHAELLLRDREAVVEEGRREAGRIVAEARAEQDRRLDEAAAEHARLVEDAVVVKTARQRAEEILADVQERADTMRRETDHYVDAKLEDFEVLLNRTLAGVHRGRENLAARRSEAGPGADVAQPGPDGDGPG